MALENTMLPFIKKISRQRPAWGLLAASVFAFELTGLFFQYVMGLQPCVMCVYERLAFIGILVAALIGLVAPQYKWLRWPAMLLWLYSSVRGLQLSLRHVDYQTNPSPFNTCPLFPDFPSWLPLDHWFPFLFHPTGDCAVKQWEFLTWEMPQWLVLIFSCYIAVAIFIMACNLAKARCCE